MVDMVNMPVPVVDETKRLACSSAWDDDNQDEPCRDDADECDTTSDYDNDDDDDDGSSGSSGGGCEERFVYHDFIRESMIEAEFGLFLDCLARRMLAEAVYKNTDETKRSTEAIQQLFCDKSADKCVGVKAPKARSVPASHSVKLQAAYESFRDPRKSWKDILYDIFLVSTCASIATGRTAVLYARVLPMQLWKYEKMYKLMNANLTSILLGRAKSETAAAGAPLFVRTAQSLVFHDVASKSTLVGEIDLILGNTVIDLKNSLYEPGKCKLDHFVQVLTYASMLRATTGNTIRYVGIYNIVANEYFEVDISTWTQHTPLCQSLVRTALALSQN